MATPDRDPSVPTWRVDLSRALLFVLALILGLFLVVRISTQQLGLITADAALASLLAIALAAAAWGRAASLPRKSLPLPDGLSLALCLWLGLNLLGAMRSPNAGACVPLAMNAILFALLLIAGFFLGSGCSQSFRWLARGLMAMGVCESFYGLWIKFVQLPRIRTAAAAGQLVLPEEFSSQIARERLGSEEIFGTFEIANSYAAFLLLSIFAQLGLWVEMRQRRAAGAPRFQGSDAIHLIFLLLQLFAFQCSGSKGGTVALALGLWFLAAQAFSTTPGRARAFRLATVAGLLSIVITLVLGAAGVISLHSLGASFSVRIEYWRTAWRMIASSADHALLGLGLGGFGECMPYFKTAFATEAKETHNDWLQLWVELGVLGPLTWGALWFTVLGPRRPVVETESPMESPALRLRSKWGFLAGGIFGFLLLFLALDAYTGADLLALLGGVATADTLRGGLAALIVPALFAAAYLLPFGDPSSPSVPVGSGLIWAVRAAIGAVLIHQLVDFPLRIPAVMAGVALLGGMLAAERARGQAQNVMPPSLLSRLVFLAMPFILLALLPADFFVLLNSGSARRSAENDIAELREMYARKPQITLDPEQQRHRTELLYSSIVRNREDAYYWAPFDGEATFELALAYLTFERTGHHKWAPGNDGAPERPLAELAAERLDDARRLRPFWAAVPSMQGHQALQLGTARLASREPSEATTFFGKAEFNYREAARLYPNAPGLRILVGDALLFQNRLEEAATAYAEAWAVEKTIFDPNVRLSAIFHDPRPGCLAKHELEPEVLRLVEAAIARIKDEHNPAALGLRLRKVLGIAWFKSREQAEGADAERLKVLSQMELTACEALVLSAPDDGHAALFAAMARLRVDAKEGATEWGKAEEKIKLQRERAEPTTPSQTLSDLRRLMNLK